MKASILKHAVYMTAATCAWSGMCGLAPAQKPIDEDARVVINEAHPAAGYMDERESVRAALVSFLQSQYVAHTPHDEQQRQRTLDTLEAIGSMMSRDAFKPTQSRTLRLMWPTQVTDGLVA